MPPLWGSLVALSDPVAGRVPLAVPFQYNPAEVTRTLRVQAGAQRGPGFRVSAPPVESYSMRIDLDALAVAGRAVTAALGIGPMLASLEAMLEPAGDLAARRPLAGAVTSLTRGGLGGGGGGTVPAPKLPLVLLVWNPERTVPVRIDDYSAHETGFNALLQPIQATVDLTLTVMRPDDLGPGLTLANAFATAYQAARSALAVIGVQQSCVELRS